MTTDQIFVIISFILGFICGIVLCTYIDIVYGYNPEIITPWNTGNNNQTIDNTIKTIVVKQTNFIPSLDKNQQYNTQFVSLHICTKYNPNQNCDIVPQNVKIPIHMIPDLDNRVVVSTNE